MYYISTNIYDPTATNGRNIGNIIGLGVNYNLWISPSLAIVPVIFGGKYTVEFHGLVTIPK
jgi:hypothetical protein